MECEEFEECWGWSRYKLYNWSQRLGGDKRNACHVLSVADLPLRVSSDPKMHSKSFGVCPSDENAEQTS
jgi:hypothetical protein